ncbi:acyl-peptide hydrolase [Streptomyces sp. V2]|uniref:prolyl oligopeptidase family serine peptidase n=1 Tax=Streptomyces sp. V2 TaxID=1424099 RepID=UPI000D66F434|nr:prolyl oligopeptidase family serine peptidase [Streptomyces sp. V2]PWG12852.1 acyl-peptide hydrolase [Streptomyces sp. V2]
MNRALPYGDWPSPITADLAAAHDGRPEYVGFVGDEVWWTAPRPAEGGRRALVRRRADGTEEAVLAAPWNVRSRVHEYGGCPWAGTVHEGQLLVVFVHFADQRLYLYDGDGGPRPLTPVSEVGGGLRWADPVLLPERGEVWCVKEEFTGEAPTDVRRVLAAVPLDGSGAVRELTDDRRRFVTGPKLSPDRRRMAWIAWDHPRMPWDGTELLVAEIDEAAEAGEPHVVAGGPRESVVQVEWAADGGLLYVSDRSGWWNLYRDGRQLCPRAEEFGGALWKLGQRWCAPLEDGRIAVVHGRGAAALGVLDPGTGEIAELAGPWTEFGATLAVRGERVVGVGAGPSSGYEVVELDAGSGAVRVVGAAHADAVDPAYCPRPVARTFDGPGEREIHAQVYPPRNPRHAGPEGELPPYVVWAHGGPTDRAPLVLDLEIAYFTSRGIGVVEVDYGGSTGYGRAYRERLRGSWGVVDVEDCAAVALALVAEGAADRRRLAIRGGSAGGWTAAVSLTRTDVYACAVIRYPVLDPVAWADGGTHDLESRYLDGLIGPAERFAQRSPVEHADRVRVPFLLLQGLDDVICPPTQCERFLERVGVPYTYLTFEGEGHGFREAATTVRALEAELALYTEVFALHPGKELIL